MKDISLAISVSLVALMVATAAQAQDQGSAAQTAASQPAAESASQGGQKASDGPPPIDQIIVTAQFRKQALQTTPLSITAVDSAMLEARSQTSVQQVSNQAPNVTLRANNTAFGSSMIAYIRGVGQDDFNFALEPGVGIYVDDVYYSSLTGTLLDLLDLQRVEILRGPQGTLAGKNSIGGAIKLYSKKPEPGTSGFMEGTVGSYSRLDFRGGVNFQLGSNLYARMSGMTHHENGYVTRLDYACTHPGSGLPTQTDGDGCKLGTEGGKAVSAGRLALRWEPTDSLDINVAGDFTQDNSEVGASVVTAIYGSPGVSYQGVPYDARFLPPNGYTSYSTFVDPRQPDAEHPWYPYTTRPIQHYLGWGVSTNIDWDLGNRMSLKSVTAYRWYRNDFSEDTDGSPLPVQMVINHTRHWQVSQELRLNGSIGRLIDYTIGGFYLKERGNGAARVDLNYGGGLDFLQNDPTPARSIAAFAQATAHVTPKLDLIAGYRITNDHKDYIFVRTNPDGSAIQPVVGNYIPPNGYLYGLDGSIGSYRKTHSDYRLDMSYRWTGNFMTYAQVSTGYKGGGVNPRPYFPSQIVAIQPETMTAFEVGLKSDLFDRRMRFNLSAFYNDYRDIQLTTTRCDAISPFPGAPCFAPLNVGSAHIKGIEAETTLRPVDGLLIDASASYLDFNYTQINPDTGVVPGDISPYTPKWKWSLGAQYEIPVSDMGSITPRVDVSYQSTTWSLAANSPLNVLPTYTLLNARLTWRSPDRSWQVALEATNLTNKYYLLSKQVPSGSGYINGQPGMPRRYAVSVRKNF